MAKKKFKEKFCKNKYKKGCKSYKRIYNDSNIVVETPHNKKCRIATKRSLEIMEDLKGEIEFNNENANDDNINIVDNGNINLVQE